MHDRGVVVWDVAGFDDVPGCLLKVTLHSRLHVVVVYSHVVVSVRTRLLVVEPQRVADLVRHDGWLLDEKI